MIAKVNTDIGNWLGVGCQDSYAVGIYLSGQQERRSVEEAYVQGLKKLASRRPHDAAAELGWAMSLHSTSQASADFLQCVPNTMAEHCQLDAVSRTVT